MTADARCITFSNKSCSQCQYTNFQTPCNTGFSRDLKPACKMHVTPGCKLMPDYLAPLPFPVHVAVFWRLLLNVPKGTVTFPDRLPVNTLCHLHYSRLGVQGHSVTERELFWSVRSGRAWRNLGPEQSAWCELWGDTLNFKATIFSFICKLEDKNS